MGGIAYVSKHEHEAMKVELADLRNANALLHGMLTNREADLRAALGAASTLARKSERLRAAGLSIIKANDEFRAGLPDGWDGDPLNDACEAARTLFNDEQKLTEPDWRKGRTVSGDEM